MAPKDEGEKLAMVAEALRQIPARYREAVVLRDVEGLSYEEVGQILRIPGGTVRSLVRDGVDGLIVSEDSVPALAKALSALMGDETRRRAFATRAPEVVTRFPLEASLTAWDKLLEDVHVNAEGVR